MKKLTRKLFMSIIAVAFAFIALGTSTYAWFAMNQEVAVTGMQISAKSDSTYLIIGSSDVLETVQNANATSVAMTVNDTEAQVYPSAHQNTVTNITTAEVVGNWYYKVADVPSASASTGSETALTSENFSKYVIKRTVYVTLAKESQNANNLKVKTFGLNIKNDVNGQSETIAPIKVLVVSDSAAVELDSTTTGENIPTTVLASTVTDEVLIQLDIYIYYNGNDAAVYTNNIANLEGAAIVLTFGVDAPQGN